MNTAQTIDGAANEPEVSPQALERLRGARETYDAAAEQLELSRLVVRAVTSFIGKRNAQRIALRAAQKSGARGAAIAGKLDDFISNELERVRVELPPGGKDFAFSDFADISLLDELRATEEGMQPRLTLDVAEAGAAVLEAQASVLSSFVEAHRTETVRQLLPVWQRDPEAVRLDTSKDGVAHISRFETKLVADAARIRSECQKARGRVVLTAADVAFWTGHELDDWDAQLKHLLA